MDETKPTIPAKVVEELKRIAYDINVLTNPFLLDGTDTSRIPGTPATRALFSLGIKSLDESIPHIKLSPSEEKNK